MLRLAQPFAKPLSPKLLKIQPSYTSVVVADQTHADKLGVHAKGKITCLDVVLTLKKRKDKLGDLYSAYPALPSHSRC
jgi:hypothetical protein